MVKKSRSRTKIIKDKPKQSPKSMKKRKADTSLSWGVAWKSFVVFSVFLGVFAILYPRPVVSPPSVPVDQNNRFSVSFDITNGGYIPLNDCGVFLGIGGIGGKGTKLNQSFNPSFKSRLTRPDWLHHNINMDERFSIVLSDLATGVEVADIAVVVSYNPWFLPIRMEKLFRFVTFKQSDSQIYWRSWPVDEPLPHVSQ